MVFTPVLLIFDDVEFILLPEFKNGYISLYNKDLKEHSKRSNDLFMEYSTTAPSCADM